MLSFLRRRALPLSFALFVLSALVVINLPPIEATTEKPGAPVATAALAGNAAPAAPRSP